MNFMTFLGVPTPWLLFHEPTEARALIDFKKPAIFRDSCTFTLSPAVGSANTKTIQQICEDHYIRREYSTVLLQVPPPLSASCTGSPYRSATPEVVGGGARRGGGPVAARRRRKDEPLFLL